MTPSDADITELPASPGARLRREREARGMTQQQAAEILTLDPSVVFALEANDFAVLGAPVFAKGHLRRYATLLGVPDNEILGAYEHLKQHMPEPSLVPKSRLEMMPERSRPKWPWVFGGLGIFLVAALVVAYISANGLPWAGNTAGDAMPGATRSAATAKAQTVANSATSAPVPGGTAATAGATVTNAAGGAPVVPPTGPVMAPGQVRLQLRFRSDSWVEVFDGSGRAVLYDLGKAGTDRTLIAAAPLSVTIGNAASVGVAINGKSVVAPRQSGQAMARFSIAADGAVR